MAIEKVDLSSPVVQDMLAEITRKTEEIALLKAVIASKPVPFTVTVQELGRVVIPKEIRDLRGIKPGDLVTMTVEKVE